MRSQSYSGPARKTWGQVAIALALGTSLRILCSLLQAFHQAVVLQNCKTLNFQLCFSELERTVEVSCVDGEAGTQWREFSCTNLHDEIMGMPELKVKLVSYSYRFSIRKTLGVSPSNHPAPHLQLPLAFCLPVWGCVNMPQLPKDPQWWWYLNINWRGF